MTDKSDKRDDEQSPEEWGNDPEVPLKLRSFLGSSDTTATKKKTHNAAQHVARAFKCLWRAIVWLFANVISKRATFWTAAATVIIAVATVKYTQYAKLQWDALIASNTQNRAYITIGRQDGTPADIVWPKGDSGNAALVVYFQNTGHVPARFNWGADSHIIEVVPADPNATWKEWKGPLFEIPTNHFFQPMYRMKSKDGKQVQWSGTIDIPGGSSYQGMLWEIPRERMLQLIKLNADQPSERRPLIVSGRFEYCDGFGIRVCRNFHLEYADDPLNRFFLAFEDECSAMETQILHPMPDYEYLSVCSTSGRPELKMALPSLPNPQ